VVFEVGGQTFAAHRWVLAARSPVFGAEHFGSMEEGSTDGLVRIDDMEAQVFRTLLCFVYTDFVPEMEKVEEDVALCQHLLAAADKYNMERMKSICEDRLCKYIGVDTVANILALAELHHCHGLKNACVSFLSSPGNLTAAMNSDGFDHLSTTCPSVIKELITSVVQ
jgi:speckle-type POZ protein